MKVLVINDYYSGGGAENVFRTTFELLSMDNQVETKIFYGSHNKVSPKNILAYFFNNSSRKDFCTLLAAFKPDIIHVHNYYHLLSPAVFLEIKRYRKNCPDLKVVFTAHDYHLLSPSSGLLRYKGKKALRVPENFTLFQLFRSRLDYRGSLHSLIKKFHWIFAMYLVKVRSEIDLVICPSFFLNNLLEKRTQLKTVVIRNPLAFHQEGNFDNKVRTSEQLRFTYIGRLSEEKGLYAFLHAFKQLTIKNKKVFLDILGEGEEKEDLIALCKVLGINKSVEFYGYLKENEVKRILERNNVLVLPSLCYENAPLSIIEGAAMGNIVIASNIGGMIELAKMTDQYYLINDWEKELTGVSEKILNSKFIPNKVKDINVFDKKNYKDNLIRLYRST